MCLLSHEPVTYHHCTLLILHRSVLIFNSVSNLHYNVLSITVIILCTCIIDSSGKDDPQERLDNIRDAVNKLHPAIGGVMRYLFRFLFKLVYYE